MIQAGLLAYFFLVAAVVFLVAFPGRRAQAAAAVRHVVMTLGEPFLGSVRRAFRGIASTHHGAAAMFSGMTAWFRGNRPLALSALALLLLPPMLILLLNGPAVFDFVDDTRHDDRQITLLLEGERLAPPPIVPPELFTTREVELVRPDIVNASRDWAMLDQDFVQRLLVVFKLMQERHGYRMVLIEGYRSPQRQEALAAQGSHVTRVGANMSYHQYGLAADAAFQVNGQLVISERDPEILRAYHLFGEIAEQVGLTWGGRWTLQDYGHVELRRPGVLGS